MLTPGSLPARAERVRYLGAVAAMEAVGRSEAAAKGYRAALERWPGDATAMFGLGNSYYGAGRLDAATAAYERLLSMHPAHGAAYNNLAQVSADRGYYNEALAPLSAGLASGVDDPHIVDALLKTREEILRRRDPE